jgi:hypothetical protein
MPVSPLSNSSPDFYATFDQVFVFSRSVVELAGVIADFYLGVVKVSAFQVFPGGLAVVYRIFKVGEHLGQDRCPGQLLDWFACAVD